VVRLSATSFAVQSGPITGMAFGEYYRKIGKTYSEIRNCPQNQTIPACYHTIYK
jgi:hypothetical protein